MDCQLPAEVVELILRHIDDLLVLDKMTLRAAWQTLRLPLGVSRSWHFGTEQHLVSHVHSQIAAMTIHRRRHNDLLARLLLSPADEVACTSVCEIRRVLAPSTDGWTFRGPRPWSGRGRRLSRCAGRLSQRRR